MDPIYCNASVDFNVPGKPNPPPVKLTATVWKQSRYLKTGILTKNAIEFTDPSGTLASPLMPLTTWVQWQKSFEYENYFDGYEYKRCAGLQDSPVVFKDQKDGDTKLVTVTNNNVTLTPFGTNIERFPIY